MLVAVGYAAKTWLYPFCVSDNSAARRPAGTSDQRTPRHTRLRRADRVRPDRLPRRRSPLRSDHSAPRRRGSAFGRWDETRQNTAKVYTDQVAERLLVAWHKRGRGSFLGGGGSTSGPYCCDDEIQPVAIALAVRSSTTSPVTHLRPPACRPHCHTRSSQFRLIRQRRRSHRYRRRSASRSHSSGELAAR
jgi:hypothetical protein